MKFILTSERQNARSPIRPYEAFVALVALAACVFAMEIAAPISNAAAAVSEKLVVSGASGQLGGEVVDALLARGVTANDLILVSRTPDKLSRFADRGAHVRFGDFDKPGSLDSAFGGGTKLLLISTNEGPPRRLAQHLAAIRAAKRVGIRHIIYTSIVAADRMAKAGVLSDHYATEEALKHSGLLWTILRNQTYAESVLGSAAIAVASGELRTNAGSGSVAYVAHRDCAEAAAAVLSTAGHAGKVYDITGPELVNPVSMAHMLGDVTGKPVAVITLLDADYLHEIEGQGIPTDYAELLTELNKTARDGILSVRSTDVAMLTGHEPISLRDVFIRNRAALLERPPQ
jgi:NAD(P)H dehydrogenase (quinone)